MAYVIAKPCIGVKDTACMAVCPCDCIQPTREKTNFVGIDQLFIDPDVCIDCGMCQDECPVEAIFPQDDLPVEWREYLQKNADYFRAK